MGAETEEKRWQNHHKKIVVKNFDCQKCAVFSYLTKNEKNIKI